MVHADMSSPPSKLTPNSTTPPKPWLSTWWSTEGAVFHMGELEFRGIDNNFTARLRAAWKIRPGDVYDATYLKEFLPQARKLLPASLDWEVAPHVTALAGSKTVDVDLQYTAKAPQ